jgi:hypothetical protein
MKEGNKEEKKERIKEEGAKRERRKNALIFIVQGI